MLLAKEGTMFEPVLEGVHKGVCYAIYDLGMQYNEIFGKSAHKAVIIWELPGERIQIERDGETLDLPRVVSKKYTLSLGDRANLRKDLESWRGKTFTPEELKGFDIHKLLGANCMIQIIHKSKDGKTYANISAILPLYKGMKKLEPENPTVIYSLDQGEPPETTPKWIVDLIHKSQEWQETHGDSPEERPSYDDEPPPNMGEEDRTGEVPF